jgi:ferredoxin
LRTERVSVDRAKCVGYGNCVRTAPRTFRLDDEGLSTVIDSEGDEAGVIDAAIDGCPSAAIKETTI